MKTFKERMIDWKFNLNFPEGIMISENSKKLILSLLKFDPEDRPEPSEALKFFHSN